MGGEDDEEVDSDAPSPRDSAHSVDDLLDLLRNPTRRSVLDHLRETPGHSSTTGELTAFLLEQSPDVERSHQEVGASLEHTPPETRGSGPRRVRAPERGRPVPPRGATRGALRSDTGVRALGVRSRRSDGGRDRTRLPIERRGLRRSGRARTTSRTIARVTETGSMRNESALPWRTGIGRYPRQRSFRRFRRLSRY